jgi:uncharacterized protein
MLKPTLAALFACLTAGLAAQSPGFDCAKATTPQEKAICASPELSTVDAAMTAAYRAWLAAAPADSKDAIRQNQRAWLQTRLSQCKPGAKPEDLTQCLLDTSKSRTEELQGRVQNHSGISFVWHAIYFTAPDSAEVAQLMKQIDRPASGYVSASWPQAISSAPEWLAWNKAIAAAAGPDSKPTRQWGTADAVDSDTDVWVALNSVSDHLVSASVSAMTYGHGAAHPNHGTTQFNWMLKEQRLLKPEDVFNPQSNWKEELYNRTDKHLHSQLDTEPGSNYQTWLGKPDEMKKTVQQLVADPSYWQIDNKGITIVFNPYEVAPYCCTPESFTMPWESLKPLLNPAFQIPTQ